jgi:hypothetical protein
MKMELNPPRIGILMRHDLQMNMKSLLSAAGTIAVIVFVAFVIASWTADGAADLADFHPSLFLNVLLIGGLVVSSVAFSQMHEPTKGMHYVMLPGSTIEKYLARLLLTSVGWTVLAIVVYTASTLVAAAVAMPIFGETPGVFLPLGVDIWRGIAIYLVTQSIFLFGSIYFKKVAFLKTTLSLWLIAFVLGLVYATAARIAFADAFVGFLEAEDFESVYQVNANLESLVDTLSVVGRILWWTVTPLFFWIVGVLRLKETEV